MPMGLPRQRPATYEDLEGVPAHLVAEIVDVAKTVETYRLDGAGWRFSEAFADDAKLRAEPFHAIELDLSVLWTR